MGMKKASSDPDLIQEAVDDTGLPLKKIKVLNTIHVLQTILPFILILSWLQVYNFQSFNE